MLHLLECSGIVGYAGRLTGFNQPDDFQGVGIQVLDFTPNPDFA
jgi:hypothetical protein